MIWRDEEQKSGVAFELKTQKNDPAEYSKQEVGQAHNHQQWLVDNEGDTAWDGLLIIGPSGICKSEANPADNLYHVEAQPLAARMNELAAKIDDTRGKTAIERWTALGVLGELPEWQVTGWFKSLARVPLKEMKP